MRKILKKELEKIKISDEEKLHLDKLSQLAANTIKLKIKRKSISAEVFVGGSLAKNTIIQKKEYDIDIFVRFNKNYSEKEIQRLMRKIMFWFKVKGFKTYKKKVHGSRDYYMVKLKPFHRISFEIVPSLKISAPLEARNITDLSYFHVEYINKYLNKNKRIADEILLAKSFCHAQKCYGAESYIRGFSGYAIELLICHYKTFAKFLREIEKAKEQIIIDPEKHYKNKQEILANLNESKKHSPIILIDPTFKERNATGALSKETFEKFQKSAREFLKNPSEKFFEYKGIDVQLLKEKAQEKKGIFAVFEFKTNKQAGDIAGTKLLKFSKLFSREIAKHFKIEDVEFAYYGAQTAEIYYVLERKKENVVVGPSIHHKVAAEGFKAKHKIWYVEEGKIKTMKRTDLSVKEFLKEFKKMHKSTMRQMGVKKARIV